MSIDLTGTEPDIVFVDSDRGVLDRGWDPKAVCAELDRLALTHATIVVHTEEELDLVADAFPNARYWPLNYTFDGTNEGPSMFERLHQLRLRQVGIRFPASRFTSKLAFKMALTAHGLATPAWADWSDAWVESAGQQGSWFAKTEYSCGSSGVRLGSDADSLRSQVAGLQDRFDDRVFVELDLGRDEWTVACIASDHGIMTAPMRITATTAPYIDEFSKNHNATISMERAPAHVAAKLDEYVRRAAGALGLLGYFRMDFIIDRTGAANAIDLNVLPLLNSNRDEISYVPAAFELAHGWDYSKLVQGLLGLGETTRDQWE